MTTYIIKLETDEDLNPGNLNHLCAVIENPASRNNVTVEKVEDDTIIGEAH